MMDKNQISNYLSDNIYSPKDQGPTTVVKNNMKAPILEGGYYTKMVAWGISNMRSDHQNSMKSPSIQKSKSTLIWTSRSWLGSDKTFFLLNIISKDTLSLNNTSSQIILFLYIIGMNIPTIPFDDPFWWIWQMEPV